MNALFPRRDAASKSSKRAPNSRRAFRGSSALTLTALSLGYARSSAAAAAEMANATSPVTRVEFANNDVRPKIAILSHITCTDAVWRPRRSSTTYATETAITRLA